MYRLPVFALCCMQFVVNNVFSRTASQPNCPIVMSLPGAKEELTPCTFTVLSLSAYIYRPSQEMNCKSLSFYLYSF